MLEFRERLRGVECSESQIFIDRLFKFMGYEGAIEAGGQFEYKIKGKRVDFYIPGKLIWESKSASVDLYSDKVFRQLYQYHSLVREPFAILCNFDLFLIYELSRDIRCPYDRFTLREFVKNYDRLKKFCV